MSQHLWFQIAWDESNLQNRYVEMRLEVLLMIELVAGMPQSNVISLFKDLTFYRCRLVVLVGTKIQGTAQIKSSFLLYTLKCRLISTLLLQLSCDKSMQPCRFALAAPSTFLC